jgi:hypothetical protein
MLFIETKLWNLPGVSSRDEWDENVVYIHNGEFFLYKEK